MTEANRARIVVGVDGSADSVVAARWAAKEAELRHLPLLLMLAVNEPVAGHSDYVFPPPVIAAIRASSRERLDAIVGIIRDHHPAVPVQTILEYVDPRRALVELSRRASMTVVGTKGRGRLPEVLIGSVALHVAAHAHCPVAVVPSKAFTNNRSENGPILLGVDGRPDSLAAVGFAFDEAAVRETSLAAVLVFDDLAYRGFTKGAPLIGRIEDDEARAVLAEELAGWCEKYPDVLVHRTVTMGRPDEQLLHLARADPAEPRPQLIVVGSRGRGGLPGLLLGSTSQYLITHSHVPVVVIRPEPER